MSLSKTTLDDAQVEAGSRPEASTAEFPYTRHGECDMCGFCCITIGRVELGFPEVKDEHYAQVRGIMNGVKTLEIIDPCSKLDQQTNLCTIHEERPRTCREFPSNPNEVIGIPCTYFFELADGSFVGGTRSPHPTYEASS